MAEAVLNQLGRDRFVAFSAGSDPADEIHPLACKVLSRAGFDMTGKRPKSLKEFLTEDFDFVITLCDRMKENCPIFPGQPIFAHWGSPDPADFKGEEEEKTRLFDKTFMEISQRVSLFINLPMEKLDRMALEIRVKEIGA